MNNDDGFPCYYDSCYLPKCLILSLFGGILFWGFRVYCSIVGSDHLVSMGSVINVSSNAVPAGHSDSYLFSCVFLQVRVFHFMCGVRNYTSSSWIFYRYFGIRWSFFLISRRCWYLLTILWFFILVWSFCWFYSLLHILSFHCIHHTYIYI